MKKYFKLLFSILAISVFLTVSCDDDDDDFLPVEVLNIDVEAAFPLESVTIQGENFNTVQFVFVGDKQADFTLSDNNLTFIVPEKAPIGHQKVTLAMVNNYRVTFDFEVLLRPVPIIETVSPSSAPEGEQVTITGLSLENLQTVTIAGVECTVDASSSTEITFTVPSGVPGIGGDLKVETLGGESTAVKKFYIGKETLITDFDGNGITTWGDPYGPASDTANSGVQSENSTSPEALDGAYYRLVQQAGSWGGSESNPVDFGLTQPRENIMLVANVNSNGTDVSYRFNVQDSNGKFWSSYSGITDGWEVIELPLAGFGASYSGDAETQTGGDIIDPALLNVVKVQYGSVVAGTEISFDNVRIIEFAFSVSEGGGPVAEEILPNGSFEDGLNTWDPLNGADQFEITTSEAYCGSQALQATGTGGNHWDVQIALSATDAPTLEEGKLYELGFWAKAVGEDGVMRASVSRWASGQSDDFFYTPDITVATDWTYYGFVFEAKTTSTGVHQLVLDFGSTTQTFYIDAVSLKEFIPGTSEYANGDFEDDLNSWNLLNGSDQFQLSTSEVYEGSGALQATGTGGNHWDVQIATNAVVLEAEKQYKLSFWAKASGEDGVMRASVSRWASGQSDDFFYSPDITVATDWTYYSYVFTAKTTSTGDHHVVLDFGTTTQTFYVDNVVVSEYLNPCQ